MPSKKPTTSNAISVSALLVGSLSSAAAAVIVHEVWRAGAILGAALTPVLIAIFNELLRRPVDRISVRTPSRVVAPRSMRVATETGAHAEVRICRARPRWGMALATGAAAFIIGISALTVSELLLDRSVGDKQDSTTLFDSGRSSPRAPTPPTTPSPSAQPTPNDKSRAARERASERTRPSEKARPDQPRRDPRLNAADESDGQSPTPQAPPTSPAPDATEPAPSTSPPPSETDPGAEPGERPPAPTPVP